MRVHRALFLLVLACGSTPSSDGGPSPDAGQSITDAGPRVEADGGSDDAGLDADGGNDAGLGDAGPVDAGPLTLTVYPRQGAALDDRSTPVGPGLVLMGGGTDVDDAFVWAHRTLAGDAGVRRGDVVVLRASGADAYTSYLLGLAPFNSVQTLKLTPPSTAADLAFAADVVSRAEFVFFAGGDQGHYAAWARSQLLSAVQQVYERGGVVGGTSAGLAIMGEYAFDAISAGPTAITSSLALSQPTSPLISFSRELLRLPHLRGVVTDSHFRARDRLGRLVVFAARQHAAGLVTRMPAEVLGLGIDEETALVVDARGQAQVLLQTVGSGGVWAIRVPNVPLSSGQALRTPPLQVTRLTEPAHRFDLTTWCGTGPRFTLSYDGGQANLADVYGVPGQPLLCP